MMQPSPKKIALFGGAFDPPHKGHTALVSLILQEFGLSEIIVLPAGDPPHKTAAASAQDRLAMCRLAFQNLSARNAPADSRVAVSDYEIAAGGISYTYQTLAHFHGVFGDKPYFIVGADSMLQILHWKQPEQIACHGKLIVAGRPPYDHALESAVSAYREKTGGEVFVSRSRVPDISSTEIRILHSFGGDLSDYLDPPILGYIQKHHLYLQYAETARAIKNLVEEERYRHTASVAVCAYKLAERYGADSAKAVRAALYHDCAKRIVTEEAAMKFGLEVPRAVFGLHPKIRHGPIGALYAQKYFHETDGDVLNAIRNHTTGRENMSLLEKIVFVADYIDPLRGYDDSPAMYEAAFRDLDKVIGFKYAEIAEQERKG
ncbi:nicotinate-nucleotide adenylyltransferase [Clostridia bacterium]|nr:nicotinate-nucleotide adenylyltransferase [Clostridia bacterium]